MDTYELKIEVNADLPLLERIEKVLYQLAGDIGQEAYSDFSPEMRKHLCRSADIVWGMSRQVTEKIAEIKF